MKAARLFLQCYALAHIVGGLLLPWLSNSTVLAPYHHALLAAFGPDATAGAEPARFLVGLMGPTIASWGLLLLLAVSAAFAQPSRQWWWGLVLAGLLWAPYDSFLSWRQGMHANIVINGLSLAALLLPLWLVRHHFLHPVHD